MSLSGSAFWHPLNRIGCWDPCFALKLVFGGHRSFSGDLKTLKNVLCCLNVLTGHTEVAWLHLGLPKAKYRQCKIEHDGEDACFLRQQQLTSWSINLDSPDCTIMHHLSPFHGTLDRERNYSWVFVHCWLMLVVNICVCIGCFAELFVGCFVSLLSNVQCR